MPVPASVIDPLFEYAPSTRSSVSFPLMAMVPEFVRFELSVFNRLQPPHNDVTESVPLLLRPVPVETCAPPDPTRN